MSTSRTKTALIATAAATATAAFALSGCGSSPSSAPTTLPYSQGGPGFDLTVSGAVTGHGTPANAGPLPGAKPSGTVGGGAGLAGCGPQPASAQRFGGAYWVAGRVDLPQVVIFRFVVPHYSAPGTFPAAASPGANPPGTAIEVDQQVMVANSGQITVTDAKSGTVAADFGSAKGVIHLTGSWRCS